MTDRHATVRHWILSFALVAAICPCANAQQIRWLTDYPAARREAADKRLPMILAVSSENCLWCRRQEQSTFVDPTVISVINQQFIALKVDAERETGLVQAMHISQYPTIVVITPDGDLLGFFQGYQEAGFLSAQLAKYGAGYVSPEWMRHDYREANKAIAESNPYRAVALLKGIVEDGKNLGVQAQSRRLLADLEQQAASRLAKAKKQNDGGQTLEAAESLAELLRASSGPDTATDGPFILTRISSKVGSPDQSRARQARELLDQARADVEAKNILDALQRSDAIIATFGDLPEAAEAKKLIASIKSNPEQVAQACETLSQRIGALYMTLAESHLKKGNAAEAQRCLEKVGQVAPGTKQAEQAQAQIVKLQKSAESKKPE